ncbi:hypothetical protein K438DRAFT_2124180 [Mycena galopus ATCC 62051]|nr:hypothetical protein K438DRAFT_2124180 [Mycena galopus ATCC 62051]
MSTAQVSPSSTLGNTAPECVGDDTPPVSHGRSEGLCWDPLTCTSGPPVSRRTGFAPTRSGALQRNTGDNQLNEPPASRAPVTAPTATASEAATQLHELISRIESLEAANSLLQARADDSAATLSRHIESLETANSLLQTRADNSVDVLSRRITVLERENSERNPRSPQAKLTPWRAINTVILLVVGVYKAAGTYLGQTTGPTTADWIVGVLWALIVYWVEPTVSFYEEHHAEDDSESEEFSLHWFFTQEVSGAVLVAPFSVFVFIWALLAAAVKFSPMLTRATNLGIYILNAILITVVVLVIFWLTVVIFVYLGKSLGKQILRFFLRLLSDWLLRRLSDFVGFSFIFFLLGMMGGLSAFLGLLFMMGGLSASLVVLVTESVVLAYIIFSFLKMAYRLLKLGYRLLRMAYELCRGD